jgi:hypothetical protein
VQTSLREQCRRARLIQIFTLTRRGIGNPIGMPPMTMYQSVDGRIDDSHT